MTRRCLLTNRCVSVSLTNQALASRPGLMMCSSSLQVTCVGHIIGAVLADTQLHAQRAAKAVKIQYEELQPIITIQVRPVTPVELTCGGLGIERLENLFVENQLSIKIFDAQEAITAQSFYQPIRTIQKGDLEVGFKQADHILEGRTVCVGDFILCGTSAVSYSFFLVAR